MTTERTSDYEVREVSRASIKDFVESNHYSKSINGLMVSHCFGLFRGEDLIGAMIYGGLAMANAWKKYGDSPEEVTELRRLVLVDDTVRNAESYFIGKTLKWLKKNTQIRTVVSYADPNYGHSGVIYRATNFEHVGMTAPGRVIWLGDRKYHDKAIRTKYKGELKPFAKRLVKALETGEACYAVQEPKHIYVMQLRKRGNK